MSLIDEVRSVEERVLARLRELAPAVSEFNELLKAAERLGVADQIELPPHDASRGLAAPADQTLPGKARSRRQPAKSKRAVAAKPKRTPASGKRTTDRPASSKARGRGAKPAAPKDDHLEAQIVATVAGRPGITVSEIAQSLGVPANTLYRPVRQLTDTGALSKRGRSLHPA